MTTNYLKKTYIYLAALMFLPLTTWAEDLFELSLMELQSIPVEVASLFEDSILDVASSTASISRRDWQNRGSLTLGQALESVPSVFTNTTLGGTEAIAIRGFATELSVRGIAHSLDGVPLGSYTYASPGYTLPRAPLNLFNQVEMIRGPGSTLYGNDAFHGVISMELYNGSSNGSEATLQAGSGEQFDAAVVSSFNQDKWRIHGGINATQDGNHDIEFSYTDIVSGELKDSSREHNFENNSAFLNIQYGLVSDAKGQFSATVFHNDFLSSEFQGLGSQFYQNIPSIFDIESISLSGESEFGSEKTQFNMFNFYI